MEVKKLLGSQVPLSTHGRWHGYLRDRRDAASKAGERLPRHSEIHTEALVEYMERHPVKKKTSRKSA